MSDWIYDNLGKLFCGVIGALFVFLYFVTSAHMDWKREQIRQCIDDGRKPYECQSMFYRTGR